METIIVILHVLFALSIVGLVLVQKSEGGGLGMGGGGGGGGMSGFMSARGTANFLTRATAIAAALFFASSLTLTILVSHRTAPASLVNQISNQAPAAPTASPTQQPASTTSKAPAANSSQPSVPVGQ